MLSWLNSVLNSRVSEKPIVILAKTCTSQEVTYSSVFRCSLFQNHRQKKKITNKQRAVVSQAIQAYFSTF